MDQQNQHTEGPSKAPKTSGEKERIRPESPKLRETSREFVEGVTEVVESVETGEIPEEVKEGKKIVPPGKVSTGGAAGAFLQPAPLVYPKIEVMQMQISQAVEKEIHNLEHEVKKITSSPAQFKPFVLNGIVAKIREFKDILANLTHVTLETLKGWWLKYVK